MRTTSRLAMISTAVLTASLAACGGTPSAEASMDAAIASLEARIPGRDRASVRICEDMASGETRLNTVEDALNWVSASMEEVRSSEDPNGMRNALLTALIGLGDAAVVSDQSAYESAAMQLATVCTDIVSGEYGK